MNGDLSQLAVAKTLRSVVIHHAHCLHESVTDGGAYEAEPSAFQILAHRI